MLGNVCPNCGGGFTPRPIERTPAAEQKPRRGMFDGLRLNAAPVVSQERGEASRMQRQPEREGSLRPAPAPDRLAERARGPSPLETAVDRYSRAYQSIDQHRREGLPVLDMQRQEMLVGWMSLARIGCPRAIVGKFRLVAFLHRSKLNEPTSIFCTFHERRCS